VNEGTAKSRALYNIISIYSLTLLKENIYNDSTSPTLVAEVTPECGAVGLLRKYEDFEYMSIRR